MLSYMPTCAIVLEKKKKKKAKHTKTNDQNKPKRQTISKNPGYMNIAKFSKILFCNLM